MALRNVSQRSLIKVVSMEEMVHFVSHLPWEVILKAISASLEPGKVLELPVPTVQNIYAWLNPKTFYSDLEYGVRCYVTLGDGQRMCHPYKTVRIEQLKTSDFQFRDPETGQEWTTKTPVKDSSDTEYVDYIRARHGMQEVLIKRFKNTKLEYILREARILGIASSLGVSPRFLGMLEGSEETWDNPAIVTKHPCFAVPLDTYIQHKPLLSRYQVFELCKRLVDVIRCLHHDQILFNDFEISHFSALGDPNPTLHPLDPLIHICDLSKATFKDGTRYDIPWSARHQFPHTAPEVLAGEPTSQSSDIFCLGKVLSSIMNAFNAADDLYLLVAWCCKRQPKDRPLVDTVHTYVVMLQALQMQKHDEPLDPIDVVDLDFTLKNQWKQHDRDQQC